MRRGIHGCCVREDLFFFYTLQVGVVQRVELRDMGFFFFVNVCQ